MNIPSPAVRLVGVGLLGGRSTEWGPDRGVGLVIHRATGIGKVDVGLV